MSTAVILRSISPAQAPAAPTEDGTIRRVGGSAQIKVDVRLMAATSKEPAEAIKRDVLREDLYYRLNVFELRLPPLRERAGDVPLLIQAFIEEFNTKYGRRVRSVDDQALQILQRHRWSGNVRELRNTIERALVACDGDLIQAAHLQIPLGLVRPIPDERSDTLAIAVGTTVADAERVLILATLAATGHNKTRTAGVLGINLKTLHNKLHRYGR